MKILKYKVGDKWESLYENYKEKLEVIIPNNEIWYKTSNNKPISINSTYIEKGNKVIENLYNEENDCCIIKFEKDVTEIPNGVFDRGKVTNMFSDWSTMTDILYLPSTITSIGSYFVSYVNNSLFNSINLSNLVNLLNIGDFSFSFGQVKKISFPERSNLTSIGTNVIASQEIDSINLNFLSSITSIGNSSISGLNYITILDISPLSNIKSIGTMAFYQFSLLKTIIIDSEKLIVNPLKALGTIPMLDSIYVNDELVEQYKEEVSKLADKFKPLSEYNKR